MKSVDEVGSTILVALETSWVEFFFVIDGTGWDSSAHCALCLVLFAIPDQLRFISHRTTNNANWHHILSKLHPRFMVIVQHRRQCLQLHRLPLVLLPHQKWQQPQNGFASLPSLLLLCIRSSHCCCCSSSSCYSFKLPPKKKANLQFIFAN